MSIRADESDGPEAACGGSTDLLRPGRLGPCRCRLTDPSRTDTAPVGPISSTSPSWSAGRRTLTSGCGGGLPAERSLVVIAAMHRYQGRGRLSGTSVHPPRHGSGTSPSRVLRLADRADRARRCDRARGWPGPHRGSAKCWFALRASGLERAIRRPGEPGHLGDRRRPWTPAGSQTGWLTANARNCPLHSLALRRGNTTQPSTPHPRDWARKPGTDAEARADHPSVRQTTDTAALSHDPSNCFQ